jgi:hypothetical protein
MANDVDLISEYVSRTGIESDTAFILANLNQVQTALNTLNKNKVSLDTAKTFRAASESAGALKTSVTGLVDAQGRLLATSNAVVISVDKTTAGATKQKDALASLNAEYKNALRNAANMSLEFGEQSEQALKAAEAAQKLKEKLDAATNFAKGKPTTNKVEYSDNLDELNTEQQKTIAATGTAISDLDRKEADAAQSANEWAQAQLNAGKAAGEAGASVKDLAGIFESATTPLQNYTGSLSDNIAQSQNYKDRLKEIAQEIKDLSQDSPNYQTKLSSLTQEQSQLKVAAGDLNSVINQQVKFLQSAEGSTDQLNAKLFIMRDVFRSLSESEKTSSFGQQLQKDIQDVYNAVKADNESIGNFHDSVGNYVGSLSPLFEKVSAELAKLKTEQQGLQDLSQRNPIGFSIGNSDRLNQVTASIEALTKVQQAGFKTTGSYAQQINTLDQALGDLSKSGTQSETFLQDISAKLNQLKSTASISSGTFAGAFKVLENELGTVRQKLNDPSLSGASLKKLQQEEQLLTQLTGNLGRVFTTTREELRSYIEASVQMATAMGEDSEAVISFQNQVGKAVNTVQDLKKTIQFQAQDTKFITGSITAVNGLIGAYSAAQGAAQLFNEDDQDLQRTMVKFQALLTIVNGLQAAANVLQTENGTIQLLLAARIGLVNAAKAVQARLFVATAGAAQAEAVAMAEAATATEATTVAQVENIATTEAATVAMTEEAAAAEVATVATRTFSTALLASGIAAIFVAIAAAVVYLAKKTYDWATSNGKALDALNKLNDAIKDGNALLVEQANLLVSSQESFKRNMESQLAASQAAGQNQLKQFAIRKQIAEEEKALAQAGVDALGVSRKKETEMLNSIEKLNDTKNKFIQDLQTAQAAGDENSADAAQKNIEGVDKKIQSILPLYNAVLAGRQRLTTATQAQDQLQIEQQKFNADEQRKLALASVEMQVDLNKSKNDAILNDDRSTSLQRLDAIRRNAAEEKKLIEAQRKDVINNPGATPNDIKIANQKAADDLQKTNRARDIAVLNDKNAVRKRDLQAEAETQEKILSLEVNTDKAIAANSIFTLGQRLNAQKAYFAEQKTLLDNSYKLQLVNAGLTDGEVANFIKNGELETAYEKDHAAELTAIRTNYEAGIITLSKDNSKSLVDITKSELQKQQALFDETITNIKDSFGTLDLKIDIKYADDLSALSDLFQRGKISYQTYLDDKRKLDRQYQKDTAASAIDALESQISKYGDTEEATAASYAKLLSLRQELNLSTDKIQQQELEKKIELADLDYQIEKALNDKKIALAKELAKKREEIAEGDAGSTNDDGERNREKYAKILEYASQAATQIQSLNDAIADRSIERITAQEDALEEQHTRETDVINQSTQNQEERNKKLADSDARYAAKRHALEQQENQQKNKKAQADKEFNIFQIAINTARAVVEALPNIPLSVVIGAIGAIELAAAIATRPPKYFKGKNVGDAKTAEDTYEGPAIVGDGGRAELIIRENGSMEVTPAQSTLTYLKSRDIVLPDAKKALTQMHEVTNNMDNRVSKVSNSTTIRTHNAVMQYQSNKSEDVHFKKFNATLKEGIEYLAQTYKNKRETHIHFADRGKIGVHEGKSWREMLNR